MRVIEFVFSNRQAFQPQLMELFGEKCTFCFYHVSVLLSGQVKCKCIMEIQLF